MSRDGFKNRMLLEVFFEDKAHQRVTQWFEFTVANGKISARPLEGNDVKKNGRDVKMKLGFDRNTSLSRNLPEPRVDENRENRESMDEDDRAPFPLIREHSTPAPGCTRSECRRCDRNIREPNGSRAALVGKRKTRPFQAGSIFRIYATYCFMKQK